MLSQFVPGYVRADGTFCMVVKFETTQNAANLRDQLTEWCNQWVAENKQWHRVWMSGDPPVVSEEQHLDYFEIFASPPYVAKAENNQLWLRLDGVYSYWWRDWGARIVISLIRAFPELGEYKLLFSCDE